MLDEHWGNFWSTFTYKFIEIDLNKQEKEFINVFLTKLLV